MTTGTTCLVLVLLAAFLPRPAGTAGMPAQGTALQGSAGRARVLANDHHRQTGGFRHFDQPGAADAEPDSSSQRTARAAFVQAEPLGDRSRQSR